MNGQIVLCKGVNDKEELNRSISDLTKYLPNLESVSVVPVGLSKYREGLYPLEPFTKEDAIEVLDMIHKWQNEIYEEWGTHFIHASDEWYILAGRELPGEDNYDGYLQLENGVGMLRLLEDEFEDAMSTLDVQKLNNKEETVSMITGKLAYPYLKKMCEKLESKVNGLKINVIAITNDFFGENITVSGLLTGQDIIGQLKDKELGERILLPQSVLRSGEDVFLDDIRLPEVEKALQVEVDIVKSSGYDFVDAILKGWK